MSTELIRFNTSFYNVIKLENTSSDKELHRFIYNKLERACRFGYLDVIKRIFEICSLCKDILNDNVLEYNLTVTFMFERYEAFELMVKNGADISLQLGLALRKNDMQFAEYIVELANKYKLYIDWNFALEEARYDGNNDLIRWCEFNISKFS